MTAPVYDKSDKGREEIATRKHQLASRLRTLLVMIDGKQSIPDLLKKVAGLGLDEQSIRELLAQGFIHIVVTGQSAPPGATEPGYGALSASAAMDDATRFHALYSFFNETIKSALGLRGYVLQLKVEKAGSIDDFRDLRQAYLDAVLKAKGKEMARSLGERLDQLLPPPEL
ncbi:MAG: hypothetical protein HYZ65_07920 [Burkholderiales bacterium]|nr:hypothetical protein [Burkholderiales bacterium]